MAFGELYSFFSDRIVSGTQSVWPWEAQRFDARARDKMALEFVLDGNDVRVDATLLTWGNAKW